MLRLLLAGVLFGTITGTIVGVVGTILTICPGR